MKSARGKHAEGLDFRDEGSPWLGIKGYGTHNSIWGTFSALA